MRWLARKDLLILGRSRLLVAVLVLYPVAIALLIGFAISRTPARPRVAIVDETPPGQTVRVGRRRVAVGEYARQLFDQVQPVEVPTRAQAVEQVTSAQALAAVVIPPDIAARVSSGTTQGQIEVVYNGDALAQSLVQSQLSSALARANLGFSEQLQQGATEVIDLLLKGGDLSVLGTSRRLVGLDRIPGMLAAAIAREPPGSARASLEQVAAFARFAAENLAASGKLLSAVGQPIAVHSRLVHGRRTPLDTFAVVVAVTVSLMFLCVLLGAGGVALEREEHTLARLIRGPVSREALLAEKGLLAGACGFVVAFAMLAGVGGFVTLHWERVGLWLVALATGALAFAALGLAIGALARDVRASSLLAFGLTLPLAFLALVPSGSVSHGFYDAISAISFAFPFKAAVQALDAAVNEASPSLGGSLAHLAVLALVLGGLARLGLRSSE